MITETTNDINEPYPTDNDLSWKNNNDIITKLKKI